MSKIEIESFSYADMYNVTAQEFGHCLGLQHVGSQAGVDPTSDLKHPEHDVMNGFYTHFVGDSGTHLHCISNLDILALEFVFGHVNAGLLPTAGPHGISYLASDLYGDTCEPPPADWRTLGGDTISDSDPPPEPTVSTTIETPQNGEVLSQPLRKIAGVAEGNQADESTIEVALARRTGATCRWLVAADKRFVKGPCEEPQWNTAAGDFDWSFRLPKDLARGKYRALSRATWGDKQEECCETGRNLVDFKLS
jgi:hypothetical protein